VTITEQEVTESNDYPVICQAENGDLVCAYVTNVDSGHLEIKCKVSPDGGATWGSKTEVLGDIGTDFGRPALLKDIDGTLYCAAASPTAIRFSISYDHGVTWSGARYLHTPANQPYNPSLCLFEGHDVLCSYYESVAGQPIKTVRRGYWDVYDSESFGSESSDSNSSESDSSSSDSLSDSSMELP